MARLDLEPTAMAAGGDAIARDADGRVVFVDGALPGERVVADTYEEHRDFAKAVVVDVLVPSPDRIAAPCPSRVAGCGGCPWQHIAAAAQPRLKASIVADALRRIAHVDVDRAAVPIEVAALPDVALRTTARVAVRRGRAGYRRHRSHEVVPVDACLAVHPALEAILVGGDFGRAREAVVRVGLAGGEAAAMLEPAAAGARLPPGVAVIGERDRRPAAVTESVAGRTFRISIRSFFQSGPVAASALVAAVERAVGDVLEPGAWLVDAYAGVGLFGSVLGARTGARVTAVESSRSAVTDARINLADLDADIHLGDVGSWRATSRVPTAVVADPSRPGLGRPGVEALASTGAGRLALVSCDPASLARDTALLADHGLRLRRVEVVDAFPHTFHVETVATYGR